VYLVRLYKCKRLNFFYPLAELLEVGGRVYGKARVSFADGVVCSFISYHQGIASPKDH
jgi:hypothetical protein